MVLAGVPCHGKKLPPYRQSDGQPLIAVESVFFKEGDNQYLGLLYKPDISYFLLGNVDWVTTTTTFNPTFPRSRSGCSLTGPTISTISAKDNMHVTPTMSPHKSHLVRRSCTHCCPGVSVRDPAEVALGEQASFRAAVSIAAPTERNREKTNGAQLHCFHVEVTNPAGELVKEYTQNVLAPAGSAGFSVPFALSDAEGLWRVRGETDGILAALNKR